MRMSCPIELEVEVNLDALRISSCDIERLGELIEGELVRNEWLHLNGITLNQRDTLRKGTVNRKAADDFKVTTKDFI